MKEESAAEVSRFEGGAWFFALFAAALSIRLLTAIRLKAIFDDGPLFLSLAARMRAGDSEAFFSHVSHPLYPWLISTIPLAESNAEVVALAWSVLGGSLAVVALGFLMRDLFDARVGWIAAFFLAFSPYGVRFSSDVASEGIYLALFIVSLASLWRALDHESSAWAALTGLLSGLAYLTRPEGAVALVAGLLLCGRWMLVRRWEFVAGLGRTCALVLGFAVTAGPHLLAIQVAGDGLVVSNKKSIFTILGLSDVPFGGSSDFSNLSIGWMGLGVVLAIAAVGFFGWRARRLEADARSRAPGWLVLLVVSLLLILRWPLPCLELLRTFVSSLRPEIVALAAFGLWSLRGQAVDGRRAFIGILLGVHFVILLGLLVNYGYLSRRHTLPPALLLLGYASVGLVELARLLGEIVERRIGRTLSIAAALAIMLGTTLAISLPKTLRDHRIDALAQRLAAEWLHDAPIPDGLLAAGRYRVGYYADREWRPLRDAKGLRELAALHAEGVRVIVVDDALLGTRDGLTATAGFELDELYRIEAGGRLAFVYLLRASS